MRLRPKLQNATERLRTSLWFTPAVMVACTIAAFVVLLRLDAEEVPVPLPLAFSGDTEAARDIAGTISGAMIGLIGVVFSLTILALQLASSQFSPRAMRGFLRDRLTKVTLGAFVSTLLYGLLTMRHVESSTGNPNLTTSGLFLATFGSVLLFIAYIDHTAHSVRVVNVLETIASETRQLIQSQYPLLEHEPSGVAHHDPFGEDGELVRREGAGCVLVSIDRTALTCAALDGNAVVEVLVRPGQYVRDGAPIARIHGAPASGGPTAAAIRAALSHDDERTIQQDVAFGLRQLVDIALRALSPGVNDPTTATQAIDRIHDLLGMLLVRDEPDPWLRDPHGSPRAWVPGRDWESLVSLATDEIRIAATGSIQVTRRLLAMFDDLLADAPSARAGVLRDRRAAVAASADQPGTAALDRRLAATADPIGMG